MKTKKPFNPFYFLLLIVGTLFAITAFAYVMMTVRLGRGETAVASGTTLIDFLAKHGTMLFVCELSLLAVLTVGAIATDEFWSRRAQRKEQDSANETYDGENL